MVPHFSQTNFNKPTKCLFFSEKSWATPNAFKPDFAVCLKYDVIEREKVKAVFL